MLILGITMHTTDSTGTPERRTDWQRGLFLYQPVCCYYKRTSSTIDWIMEKLIRASFCENSFHTHPDLKTTIQQGMPFFFFSPHSPIMFSVASLSARECWLGWSIAKKRNGLQFLQALMLMLRGKRRSFLMAAQPDFLTTLGTDHDLSDTATNPRGPIILTHFKNRHLVIPLFCFSCFFVFCSSFLYWTQNSLKSN